MFGIIIIYFKVSSGDSGASAFYENKSNCNLLFLKSHYKSDNGVLFIIVYRSGAMYTSGILSQFAVGLCHNLLSLPA